jgi:hypothetical protein
VEVTDGTDRLALQFIEPRRPTPLPGGSPPPRATPAVGHCRSRQIPAHRAAWSIRPDAVVDNQGSGRHSRFPAAPQAARLSADRAPAPRNEYRNESRLVTKFESGAFGDTGIRPGSRECELGKHDPAGANQLAGVPASAGLISGLRPAA